ncbi:MAG: OmpA family protein, partial [Flavobacteriales bacterium]
PSSATPDYFNACSTTTGVPDNIFGDQPALEGEAYAGIVTYASTKKNYREYLQQKLSRPLVKGEVVCVEFWVSCADKSLFVTDGFGAHFSKSPLSSHSQKIFDVRPQVSNPSLHLLEPQDRWVKISDTFNAAGGEQYITLGSFTPDGVQYLIMRTAAQGVDGTSSWAYVYVDEVVVKSVEKREDCSCLNDEIKAGITDPPRQLSEYREIEEHVLYFDFDDSTVTKESSLELDKVAVMLRNHPYRYVEVNGHADVVGPEGHNIKLSKNRAVAVLRYLKEQGVDPNRLKIVYHGSSLPAIDELSAKARAKNRRVEFTIRESVFIKMD